MPHMARSGVQITTDQQQPTYGETEPYDQLGVNPT